MFAAKDLAEYLPLLARGALITVEVFALALVVATVLGLGWALMRVSSVPVLRGFSKALINTIRGIPILVQLFYIYFVFPEIGIQLSAFEAGVIGLGFAYSCYMVETEHPDISIGSMNGAAAAHQRRLSLVATAA